MDCTGCSNGIAMCHNRPCAGTPEEFDKIIDAGYADKLRIDYWTGSPEGSQITFEETQGDGPFVELRRELYKHQQENPNPHREDVEFLSGGTDRDKENYRAPFLPIGTCKLLTKDDKCMLHDAGLKPEQGRESCCNDKKSNVKSNLYYATLWATPKGKAVVRKFKKTLNIN